MLRFRLLSALRLPGPRLLMLSNPHCVFVLRAAG